MAAKGAKIKSFNWKLFLILLNKVVKLVIIVKKPLQEMKFSNEQNIT